MLTLVRRFRLAELRAIHPPDDHGKNLVGVRLIEVEERGAASTSFRPVRANHLAADCSFFPHVIFRLGRCEVFLSQRWRKCQQQEDKNTQKGALRWDMATPS